ncbi:hypothetical protein ACFF2X_35935, partial [Cryptosporangium minutisporangium]
MAREARHPPRRAPGNGDNHPTPQRASQRSPHTRCRSGRCPPARVERFSRKCPAARGGPRYDDPGAADPGTANPGTANPGTANPGTANPGTANPGTANPGTANPGTANPGTANP